MGIGAIKNCFQLGPALAKAGPDFRDGIKWNRVDTFGSYLFKDKFDCYTSFREINILKDLKKKSSITDYFDILRLFRKTGTLSKKKLKTLRNSCATFQTSGESREGNYGCNPFQS
ncbi:hypothetical protein AVEN_166449-1 [Araneus ventricosus]|uniref:Uncharacterized protein n=1 Tax=Araneus ventricosus TaxID=182803 RepID=A0A4Y2F0E8_ARAVE|nr:hypothetical protein AVEN_166449-1 [Araneus ventricosus]